MKGVFRFNFVSRFFVDRGDLVVRIRYCLKIFKFEFKIEEV